MAGARGAPLGGAFVKIVFVAKALGLPGGGAERVLSQVAPALSARGHAVTVLSRDPPGSEDFYAMPGVRRVRRGIGTVERRAGWREVIGWIFDLRTELRRARPDVVVGLMHSSYLPVGLALLGTGIPVVASEHTVYGHYAIRPKERWALALAP